MEEATEKLRHRPVISQSSRQWSPPPSGWLKVNIDAATFASNVCRHEHGRGSCVIRNEDAGFICARAHKISAKLQPREAEVVGLKEALSWIKELGFKNCIFETDAKMLADACNGVKGRSFFHTNIVLVSVELFKHFHDVLVNVLVKYVHRSANVVAHILARATHDVLVIDSI